MDLLRAQVIKTVQKVIYSNFPTSDCESSRAFYSLSYVLAVEYKQRVFGLLLLDLLNRLKCQVV